MSNEEVVRNETVLHIFYPLPPEPDVKRVQISNDIQMTNRT